MRTTPCELTLELARAEDTAEPFQFRLAPQDYLLREEGGRFQSAPFAWDSQVLSDLGELTRLRPDRVAVQRLGTTLRSFLARLDWGRHEARLTQALAEQRPVHLTLRFAAAELYALPWELVTLESSGQHLGELPGCLIRYEWPGTHTAPPAVSPAPEGGRLLFAWSAAGGPVPATEHLRGLREAASRGEHAFDERRDVLSHVSLQALKESLASSPEPIGALHLLCHGSRAASGTYGLAWNGSQPGGEVELVDAGTLRQVLGPHAGRIRMVVLCACQSGDPGPPANPLGSIAQALHRVGIPAVVASRLPLSVEGSIALTQTLYTELLEKSSSLQQAVQSARARLAQEAVYLDWASLQLYARAEDGADLRPFVIRPYRGLLAFQATDRRFFFGRDQLQQVLLRRAEEAMAGRRPRFQVVAGASGSGKSSLVRAGLVPEVLRLGWDVVVLRPGEAEASRVSTAVEESADGGRRFPSLTLLWHHLRRQWMPDALPVPASREDVWEEARRLSKARPGGKLLLVVDQLEEVFTHLAGPERQAFVTALWGLAGSAELHLLVLATLRVDDFGECGEVQVDESDKRLDSVVYDDAYRLFVPQIQAEHFKSVIEEPARRVGLELEEGLADLLQKDVGQEPGALPLLEYALDLLWQQREGSRLTHRAYKEMGGVTGALTGTADRILEGLSELELQQGRRLLVELVDFREETAPSTRRRTWLAQVRPTEQRARMAFNAVLDRLVASRLLVTGGEDSGSQGQQGVWIEFAHEALIRRWERLAVWVREDGERVTQLRRLRAEAAEWRAHRDDADGGAPYLLTGIRLSFARSLRELHPGEVRGELADFLEASSEAALRGASALAPEAAVKPGTPAGRTGTALRPYLLLTLLTVPVLGAVGLRLTRSSEAELAPQSTASAPDASVAAPADASVAVPVDAGVSPVVDRTALRESCRRGSASDCEAACSAGDKPSCAKAAKLYEDKQDWTRAARLNERACQAGAVERCTSLGLAYETGLGVARDPGRAGKLYAQGCQGGDADGCMALGSFYTSGPGAMRSAERAQQAYQRACKLGSQDGCALAGEPPP